jgi:predicted short-subunit dehydrogenase-like oxidoreductase (DUF2520 family)
MVKISIIGYGNVAQHLIPAFQQSTLVSIQQVFLRDPSKASASDQDIEFISDWSQLRPADIFFLAVSDDAIAAISAEIPLKNQLIVHTSGSVSFEDMSNANRRGVFYPLQTFTKGKTVHFKDIPICIESEFSADLEMLQKIAKAISDQTYIINSQQRRALHVAAVFVNNFVNHLYHIGSEICQDNQVPFSILEALIEETSAKIKTLSPKNAQTGPAKRSDQQTIDSHLHFLQSDARKQSIYTLLTQSIQNNGKKL